MTDHDPQAYDVEPEHVEPEYARGGDVEADPYLAGGARRRRKSRLPGCLAALAALAVLVTGGVFLVTLGKGFIDDRFGGAQDYPGPGSGEVDFQVEQGDTAAEIGRNLKAAGVVASVEAFLDVAASEPKSSTIQVGTYPMLEEMAAADALAVLIDPSNLVRNTVTIPEGLRVVDTVDVLAKNTDFSRGDFEKVLEQPDKLGLPAYADGNPEGYLFPATYDLGPKTTAKSLLKGMVKRFKQAAKEADLSGAADRLGYTEGELVTIASLVEAEARGKDMPKVSRVIYNRLDDPTGPTIGRLQIDATVNFALDRKLGVALTTDDLEVDSPYNTYLNAGLPPGPIEAPGMDALKAATDPADGDWLFYVTVNLRTGKTKFTADYDEFLRFKDEFKKYCETSEAC